MKLKLRMSKEEGNKSQKGWEFILFFYFKVPEIAT